MKLRFRTVFWIGAALVVVLFLVWSFRPQPLAVDVAEAFRGPLRVTVRDEGRTRVREEYVVSSPVAGRLLRVEVEAGTRVEAGQVVARVRPSPPGFLDARAQGEGEAAVAVAAAALSAARAELERARAQARLAASEAGRAERLRAAELISDQDLERTRTELRVAESAVDAAEDNQRVRAAELGAARARAAQPGALGGEGSSVEVHAPVAGRVLRVTRESENVIAAGSEVMAIGDPEELEVVVEMLSTEAVQVRPGAEVAIEGWGGAEAPLAGRVRRVEPAGFLKVSALGVEEQRVNVIVDLVEGVGRSAADAGLGHGYRVEAAIVTWQAADVVQVPVAALFRSAGEWAVFRVAAGRAELAPVDIGRDNGRHAQILSGLEGGETVVLYPGDQLSDGVRVRTRSDGG
ncbi:MAG TPA: HlyD family efflux transporter periplasmic adaptor subunit [Thermoanaerobaculia bacterium]|nr:HlyD family efflux transporter periplasmic adaptor subunit [Thermoanaerobaculia bacterium]